MDSFIFRDKFSDGSFSETHLYRLQTEFVERHTRIYLSALVRRIPSQEIKDPPPKRVYTHIPQRIYFRGPFKPLQLRTMHFVGCDARNSSPMQVRLIKSSKTGNEWPWAVGKLNCCVAIPEIDGKIVQREETQRHPCHLRQQKRTRLSLFCAVALFRVWWWAADAWLLVFMLLRKMGQLWGLR